MKALVYTAPGQVQMQEVPPPKPMPGRVVVRVEATGICGSDVAGFLGQSSRRQPPLILGHEVVGRIEDPSDAPGLRAGQRVVVNPLQTCGICPACRAEQDNQCLSWRLLGMDEEQGGFAELVQVDARNVFPIPDDMPLEAAAMVEPAANTVHVLRMLQERQPETLLIIGGGAQGILALLLARRQGIRRIAVVERDEVRRNLILEMYPEAVLDPLRVDVPSAASLWSGGGADAVLEAVGTSETRSWAVTSVRNGGLVILLGLHESESPLHFAWVVRREITLQGSFAYTRRDFAASLEILMSGQLDCRRFVRTLPLDKGQRAFESAVRGTGAVLKLLLVP